MIQRKSPTTQIYVQSILPVKEDNKMQSYAHKNKVIIDVNKQLEVYCKKKSVTFINLYPTFVANGEIDTMYTLDGLHLNEKGYKIWEEKIKPYVLQ